MGGLIGTAKVEQENIPGGGGEGGGGVLNIKKVRMLVKNFEIDP